MMSRTMESLRFYPIYKLSSYPASFTDAGRGHRDAWFRDKRHYLQLGNHHFLVSVPWSRFHGGDVRGPRLPACVVGCSAGEASWPEETWITIVCCWQVCPSLQMETSSLLPALTSVSMLCLWDSATVLQVVPDYLFSLLGSVPFMNISQFIFLSILLLMAFWVIFHSQLLWVMLHLWGYYGSCRTCGVHVFWETRGEFLPRGTVGSYGMLIFSFRGCCRTSFQSGHSSLHSAEVYEGSDVSTSLPTLGIFHLFHVCRPSGYKWVLSFVRFKHKAILFF